MVLPTVSVFLSVQCPPCRINGLTNVNGYTGFSYTSPEQQVFQGKNIVDAAKECGIQHMVWSTVERTEYKTIDFATKYFCTPS